MRKASFSSARPASFTTGASISATSLRSGAADASSARTSSITSPPLTAAIPNLKNLILDPYFCDIIGKSQAHWRHAVQTAIEYGVAVPAFSAALSYYDSYRAERLPANLLQAQRDYFGAHTYERVDKPAGEFFHTEWLCRGEVTDDLRGSFATTFYLPRWKASNRTVKTIRPVKFCAKILKTPLTRACDAVF